MEKSTDLLLEEVRQLYDQLEISTPSNEPLEKVVQNYWETMERLSEELIISSSLFMSR